MSTGGWKQRDVSPCRVGSSVQRDVTSGILSGQTLFTLRIIFNKKERENIELKWNTSMTLQRDMQVTQPGHGRIDLNLPVHLSHCLHLQCMHRPMQSRERQVLNLWWMSVKAIA